MTAPRKHWYLIAYDVREPKRLQRIHYHLRKHALAVQKSVFLLHADADGLAEVERGLRERADARDDDLRLYAVPGPAALWAAGQQGTRMAGLHGGDARPRGGVRDWFKGLFGREAA
jgi:CRISPR-associated protein Cas2